MFYIYGEREMKKIFDFEVFDIIPCPDGIIASRKELVDENSFKVSFLKYDANLSKVTPVTKDLYQLYKFGENYALITDTLGDYVSCDASVFKNGSVAVVYPTGETGLFDKRGRNVWTGDLLYHDCPINGIAANGTYFWSTIPLQNAIVSYSVPHKKFSMRIGSETSTTFSEPVSISLYKNELFVCNAGSCKIRSVDLKNYLASDFRQFEEPVYKYLRCEKNEYVILSSGIYIL